MKVLGTTTDVTTCDCCGKQNLKHTVIVEDNHGSVSYYGQVCASRWTMMPQPLIKKAIKSARKQRIELARTEFLASPAYAAYADCCAQLTDTRPYHRLLVVQPFAEEAERTKTAIIQKHKLPGEDFWFSA